MYYKIIDINESFSELETDDINMKRKTIDTLSVFEEGYKYSPLFRAGIWNGKREFYTIESNTNIRFPKGLVSYILKHLKEADLPYEYNPITTPTDVKFEEFLIFVDSLKLPFKPYDYQLKASFDMVRDKRGVYESATSSGKSLILYMFLMYMLSKGYKSVLVVPSVSLTLQMKGDFEDYGLKNSDKIIKLIGGEYNNKDLSSHPITISTWQSLQYMSSESFALFDCIAVDECLDGDTLITMGDGSTKQIKNIQTGDIVKTINEESDLIENKEVIKKHTNIPSEEMYEIITEEGILKITGNHKVNTLSGWVRADDLKVQCDIVTLNPTRTHFKILSIKKIAKPPETYNLHIKDNHNYFANNLNVSNCHGVAGDVLTNIIHNSTNAKWKIGVTGTIPRTKVDKIQLLGALGRVYKVINPQGLIDMGLATPVFINNIYLNYSDADKAKTRDYKYPEEEKFVTEHHYRNIKVAQLMSKLSNSGNVLGLFNKVEHGKLLLKNVILNKTGNANFELLEKLTPNPLRDAVDLWRLDKTKTFYFNSPITIEDTEKIAKNIRKICTPEESNEFISRVASLQDINIYFIYGGVSGDDRENIRKILETVHIKDGNGGVVILASFGTTSTGTNFKNLHHVVLCSSTKSFIRVSQTIGRGMRKHESKEKVNIWDIIDDLTHRTNKTEKENHMLRHSFERIAIFRENGYPISEKEINLECQSNMLIRDKIKKDSISPEEW